MKKAFVFDFDFTLAVTDCRIFVKSTEGTIVDRLDAADYNDYKLKENEYFDYVEFRCDKKITEACATFLIHLAKEVHDEDHDVYVLTARGEACADAIKIFMKEHGIETKFVYCVGDREDDIEKEKRKVLLTLIEPYDKIYVYDDNENNINHVPDHPKIRKYLINEGIY